MTDGVITPTAVSPPLSYEAVIDDYERYTEPFMRIFAEAALSLAGVASGESVLDVAAGTGALAIPAAELGADVTAVDISQLMVDRLAGKLPAQPLARVERMNGEAMSFPDASFDHAFSTFGVMLFPGWRAGLREMARVVRPGGTVGVVLWAEPEAGAGPSLPFFRAFRRSLPGVPPPAIPEAMTVLADPDRFQDELVGAGCRDASVHDIAGSWVPPSDDWLAGNMDRMYGHFPFYQTLSAEQRVVLRAALIEELEQHRTPAGMRMTSVARIGLGRR